MSLHGRVFPKRLPFAIVPLAAARFSGVGGRLWALPFQIEPCAATAAAVGYLSDVRWHEIRSAAGGRFANLVGSAMGANFRAYGIGRRRWRLAFAEGLNWSCGHLYICSIELLSGWRFPRPGRLTRLARLPANPLARNSPSSFSVGLARRCRWNRSTGTRWIPCPTGQQSESPRLARVGGPARDSGPGIGLRLRLSHCGSSSRCTRGGISSGLPQ